jgi:hypothetical protein
MSKNKSHRATVRVSFTILTALLLATAVGGTFLTSVSPVASAEEIASSPKPPIPVTSVGKSDAATQVRMSEAYGKLPLYFEANRGQTDQRVKFLSRGAGHTLFLTSTEAVLVLAKRQPAVKGKPEARDKVTGTVLQMSFLGANPQARVMGREERAGKANYFIGNESAKWRTNVPTHGRVHYQELYPGIDLAFYGNQRQLEYDFVVSPGADLSLIALGFRGVDNLEVDGEGDLVLHTAAGTIRQRKPVIYQEVDGVRREIAGGYVIKGRRQVGFQVAAYDGSRPLVIDPVLVYSTYLGGSGNDQGFGIAVDAVGNAYVTGLTNSTNFPTTAGAFDTSFNGVQDVFVAKIADIDVAPPATLTLTPAAATNPVNTQHCVTATVNDVSGNPTRNVTVRFTIAGAVNTTGSATTNVNGQATFCYTGPALPGADAITAYADTNPNNTQDAGEPSGAATKTWVAGAPATLTLTPPTATNPVNTQHCVTATVKDAFGNPRPGVTVRFKSTGSATASGFATTNANGQATFCYTGPALPGADAITAYVDTNSNNTQDAGEPSGAATKTWVLPVTTPLCTITITNGGRITANNGDRASFGGNAKADAKGKTSGQQQYQDHGPAQKMNVHSINVLAIVCQGTTQASIYGQATINGSGSFFYRINVQDLGEPGVGKDTYGILLQNGYNSGEHKLEGGNVQIRRK